jgi:phosphohistidine phosphatase
VTTRTLLLLRHAKSSWDEPGLDDRDRPLAERGVRATARIAAYLRREQLSPSLVLCSTALRTRQTLELLGRVLPDDATISLEDALYAASASRLLARLHEVPASVPSVLVIGHNPGLAELAVELAGNGGETVERLREHFPTAALATLATVDTPWRALAAGRAELTAYVVPRDLP